jgi:hypothetical protein
MGSELAKLSDVKDDLLYRLRLNKLDKTSRTLQKHGVIDTQGFLTIEGAQVFLDALWQSHPEVQKEVADSILKMKKLDKKEKKSCDED